MLKRALGRLRTTVGSAAKDVVGRPSVLSASDWLRSSFADQRKVWRPILKHYVPNRLIVVPRDSPEHLSPIEQVRRACHLTIPTSLPSLDNPRLLIEVLGNWETGTGTGRLGSVSPYHAAYHHERLEWFGDRELNLVAAKVLFVMGPVFRLYTPTSDPRLAWHNSEYFALTSNAFGASLGKEFEVDRNLHHPSEKDVADRFEAFVGALWISKGHQATLEFLAPLFHREMLARTPSFDSLPPLDQPLVQTGAFVSSSPPAPSLEPSSSEISGPLASSLAQPRPSPLTSPPPQVATPGSRAPSPAAKETPKSPTEVFVFRTIRLCFPTLIQAKADFLTELSAQGLSQHLTRSGRSLSLRLPGYSAIIVRKKNQGITPGLVGKIIEGGIRAGFVSIEDNSTSSTSQPSTPSTSTAPPTPPASEPTPPEPSVPPTPPAQVPPLCFRALHLAYTGLGRELSKRSLSSCLSVAKGGALFLDLPGWDRIEVDGKGTLATRKLVDFAVERGMVVIGHGVATTSSDSADPAPSPSADRSKSPPEPRKSGGQISVRSTSVPPPSSQLSPPPPPKSPIRTSSATSSPSPPPPSRVTNSTPVTSTKPSSLSLPHLPSLVKSSPETSLRSSASVPKKPTAEKPSAKPTAGKDGAASASASSSSSSRPASAAGLAAGVSKTPSSSSPTPSVAATPATTLPAGVSIEFYGAPRVHRPTDLYGEPLSPLRPLRLPSSNAAEELEAALEKRGLYDCFFARLGSTGIYSQSLKTQGPKLEVWGQAADWRAALQALVDTAVSEGYIELDDKAFALPSFLGSITSLDQRETLPPGVLHFATMRKAVSALQTALLGPGHPGSSELLAPQSKPFLRLSIPGHGSVYRSARSNDPRSVAAALARLVLDSVVQGAITLDPSFDPRIASAAEVCAFLADERQRVRSLLPLQLLDDENMPFADFEVSLKNVDLNQYFRHSWHFENHPTRSLSLRLPSEPSIRLAFQRGMEAQGMREFLLLAAEQGVVAFGPKANPLITPVLPTPTTPSIASPLPHISPRRSEIAEPTPGDPPTSTFERHIPPPNDVEDASSPIPASLPDPPTSETASPLPVTLTDAPSTPSPEPLAGLPSNDSPVLAESPEHLVYEPVTRDVVAAFEPTPESTGRAVEPTPSEGDSSGDQGAPSNERAAEELSGVVSTEAEVVQESGAAGASFVEGGGEERAGSEGTKM